MYARLLQKRPSVTPRVLTQHPPLPLRSTTPLRSTSVSSMMPRSALLSSTAARVAATAWGGVVVEAVERKRSAAQGGEEGCEAEGLGHACKADVAGH